MSGQPKKHALPEGVYGITSGDYGLTQVESAKLLLEAGIRMIQYREKKASSKKMYEEALAIRRLCDEYGATFIVDDRVDIALAVGADGVHVGRDDLPPSVVREIFPEGIIGVSACTVEEATEAEAAGATYLGVGSIYPSPTKPDSEVIGEEGLRRILERVRTPVYAIGGIRLEHVRRLRSLGVKGVVAISAILAQKDPLEAAKSFVREWAEAK